ncbi:hypothetical protein DQ04_01311040 [Trypanosoma grayi]|uniref:hypothetical protein n=1 Tax=Trypanosoma grayi TaxID=71804 RepID=UPI0004F3FC46|nr:hypothetical protein DQ04_01311040 [Trypanosoma grayi]KEG12945.1 hypothetical protein DQ04_01311040 [Trypanosoma grayi]
MITHSGTSNGTSESASTTFMPTATLLQRLLKEEGAFFHPAMQVRPIARMGGGYGVMAAESLTPGMLLAEIPWHSMITPSKVRRHVASYECRGRGICSGGKQPSIAKPSEAALASMERELAERLSPTNSIVCFLLLAAAQEGRFTPPLGPAAVNAASTLPTTTTKEEKSDLVCNHKWMKPWLLSLPAQYDNLLELCPEPNKEPNEDRPEAAEWNEGATTDAYLQSFLFFERHRSKTLREQENVKVEFDACRSVLSVLNALPRPEGQGPLVPATLRQFLWAYNTLMTRGFAYDAEVWALMPWVDYFNYSLTSNATMKFDAKRRAYIFETLLPIKSGEQILLHYGSYTDMELLLWYGFTLTPFLLPELARSTKREESFQTLRRLLCEEAVASGTGHDEEFMIAVDTALGYSFSPWAEADGSYPRPKPRESWIEQLIASYVAAVRKVRGCGDTYPSILAAATAADKLVKGFVAIQGHQMPSQLIAHDCRLGARGPSPSMLLLLKYFSRVCSSGSAGIRLTTSEVLRAICWAELVCNNYDAATGSFGVRDTAALSTVDAVRRMARQASLDAASLLHFLALEATEAELKIYLSRGNEG